MPNTQEMNAMLSTYGINLSPDSFSFGNIMAGIIFGIIGLYAFNYGRKEKNYRPLTIGLCLMVYPYFVSNSWLMWGIGIVLSSLLYFWRD